MGGPDGMRALLVDLDDTLLDYSGGVDESWEAACGAVALPRGLGRPALVAAVAETRQWFWADPERHRRERTDMLGAWRKIAAHALAGLGAPEALAAPIAHEYAARRRAAMRLFPGAVESLDALRQQGVALALVTNGDTVQQRDKIERFALAPLFDTILIEGEFGAGKPEEAVYRHALGALGARPAEAWMVGDHLEWDVAAPQRLGLRGVWVDRAGQGLPPGSPVRPHRIIRDLRELARPSDR